MRADREIDFHGHTREEMRDELDHLWTSGVWAGLQCVRVIHGRGAALWRELQHWCRERGLEFHREHHGGSTLVQVQRHGEPRSSGPPNRPLAGLASLLPHLPPEPPAPRRRPPPVPRPSSRPEAPPPPAPDVEDDHALFEQAVRQLEREDPRVLRKRKGAG